LFIGCHTVLFGRVLGWVRSDVEVLTKFRFEFVFIYLLEGDSKRQSMTRRMMNIPHTSIWFTFVPLAPPSLTINKCVLGIHH